MFAVLPPTVLLPTQTFLPAGLIFGRRPGSDAEHGSRRISVGTVFVFSTCKLQKVWLL